MTQCEGTKIFAFACAGGMGHGEGEGGIVLE